MSTARYVLQGNAEEVVAIEFFQSSASKYLGLGPEGLLTWVVITNRDVLSV